MSKMNAAGLLDKRQQVKIKVTANGVSIGGKFHDRGTVMVFLPNDDGSVGIVFVSRSDAIKTGTATDVLDQLTLSHAAVHMRIGKGDLTPEDLVDAMLDLVEAADERAHRRRVGDC